MFYECNIFKTLIRSKMVKQEGNKNQMRKERTKERWKVKTCTVFGCILKHCLTTLLAQIKQKENQKEKKKKVKEIANEN